MLPHTGFRRSPLLDDAFWLVVTMARVDPGKAELTSYPDAGRSGDTRETQEGQERFVAPGTTMHQLCIRSDSSPRHSLADPERKSGLSTV